jgi:hypothetical protein
MGRVKFTVAEGDWLVSLLNERIEGYQSDTSTKYVAAAKAARQAFQWGEGSFLNPFQKALCTGCVNVALDVSYQNIHAKNAVDLLHADVAERAAMTTIDMGKDILQKLGYEKKTRYPSYDYSFRYRDCLQAIDKLKEADTICLSHVQNNVYKINFIYKGVEQFQWEMSHSLSLSDIRFYPLRPGEFGEFARKYSMVSGRSSAVALVAGTDCSWYPDNVLEFFNQLLN